MYFFLFVGKRRTYCSISLYRYIYTVQGWNAHQRAQKPSVSRDQNSKLTLPNRETRAYQSSTSILKDWTRKRKLQPPYRNWHIFSQKTTELELTLEWPILNHGWCLPRWRGECLACPFHFLPSPPCHFLLSP